MTVHYHISSLDYLLDDMGGSMGFLGKGVPPTQMMNMVMGSLYKQFTKKAINNFDDFHVAVLDIFNNFNSALPGRHFDLPTPDEIKARIDLFNSPCKIACFLGWKEAKDEEEKKKVFTEFIAKKVKPSKVDDVTMITGIASPPAAMAAKRAGENVPQLKFIKLIPDVIFVPTVTILAIVSAKLSRRMMSALNRTLSSSISLKLNTPFPIFALPNSKPSEIRFSNRWGNEQRKVERSLSHSLALLDHQSCTRRRDQIHCGGGGDHHHVGVWWDLNTCPLPAGVDPRCVRPCIESALEKLFGRRSAVSIYIYAIGNLEFISSDLLQNISSSGIILTHAPCGMHDLHDFLVDWSEDELKNPHPPGYVMIISSDYKLLYPERFRLFRFTTFVAYPKGVRLLAHLTQLKCLGQEFDEVFAKEFVWETLLSDNLDETLLLSDNNTCDEKPLCICNICSYDYEVCDEFITHLKCEEHINQWSEIVHDRKLKYFCQVCNYPAYSHYNLFLHNQSEAHNRKLVEKQAQEEEDCQSRKTNPELDLFYERNKEQSL
ncbi:unnamed protein product [Brassica rapa subsp. narinosa]